MEHHPKLFDLQSPKVQDYLQVLVKEKGFERIDLTANARITVPAAELNLLLLNVHILKHAMGKGIGLRQFCDMARAYAVLGKRVDGEELKAIYERTGIGAWSRLLHAFLTEVVGLSATCLPYREAKSESIAPLWNIVWRGGNFGRHRAGGATEVRSLWKRKWETCRSFGRNARFSLKYAPDEAIHTFGQLMKGQFK